MLRDTQKVLKMRLWSGLRRLRIFSSAYSPGSVDKHDLLVVIMLRLLRSVMWPDAHYLGTFELEQKTDDIVYGVVDQVHSWNPTYIQVSFFSLHSLSSPTDVYIDPSCRVYTDVCL